MIAGVMAGGVPATGITAATSHSRWRLRYISTESGAYCSLGGLEMAATVGGADQCAGGSGFASDTGSGGSIAGAFDNNPATGWYSFDPPQTIGYLFPAPVFVTSVRIAAENGNLAGPAASPKDFAVEWSDDGVSWIAATTVTGQTGWVALEVRSFNF